MKRIILLPFDISEVIEDDLIKLEEELKAESKKGSIKRVNKVKKEILNLNKKLDES